MRLVQRREGGRRCSPDCRMLVTHAAEQRDDYAGLPCAQPREAGGGRVALLPRAARKRGPRRAERRCLAAVVPVASRRRQRAPAARVLAAVHH